LREFKDSIGGKDKDAEEPDAFGQRQQLEAAETRPAEPAQDRPASRVEN